MFKGNFTDMIKQAQEMGQNLKAKQEELATKTIEVSVGGDMVRMTFNGNSEVLAVSIDPEVVDKTDVKMLEDLVRAAINKGVEQSQGMMKAEMAKLAGGINIPGVTS